ncbi:flagellin N-terminal helical domain-containing protein [Adhaeretor mobilis]|uniref:Flagellin n=1 Tax=Adhaeretor mobilis TaxID=1930276 RepID=A0A517MTY2_9BACT|nr:flagellin [Adhaeretor mobilis]QDS98322.1 Flagellar hook-associated protein 3 [Adhaeretor mobilis]
MAGSIPIPTTRAPGILAQQRLVQQLQADQLALFQVQNQISTGRRINLPSDDAPAALRAITLQRLIERKEQLDTNISTGRSFLESTDATLNSVSDSLIKIRGEALGVAGTDVTQSERDSVATLLRQDIQGILQSANTNFRGRYLFAGAQTSSLPFERIDDFVAYQGDGGELQNYSDIDVLFSSNSAGSQVFGGFSSQVVGSTDLNPQLTANTPLSSLREGRGITPNGSIAVSDGTNISVVDLSSASTIGDVVRLIEASPPDGRKVSASFNATGLSVQIDSEGGGNLTISEFVGGRTASELGILEVTGVGVAPIVGGDLNPVLRQTTRLDDLLGAKASARLISPGDNNDILLEASVNGALLNGASIQLVDDDLLLASAGVGAGSEFADFDTNARASSASLRLNGAGDDLIVTANTPGSAFNDVKIFINGQAGLGNSALANYDSINKRLTITIDDAGATTAQEVVNAIDGTGQFTATHDNSVEGAFDGAALLDPTNIANVVGDTGKSGGDANTLYVHVQKNATTANQVVTAINTEGTFTAQADPLDTTLLAQQGTGLVTTGTATIATGGSGESLDLTSGLRVVNGGNTFDINFTGAETVAELLNELNAEEYGLRAELNETRTGINISTRWSGTDFQIGENGGTTATQLGVRSYTEDTKLSGLNYGVGVPAKDGDDFTIISQDTGGLDVALTFDVSSASSVGDVIDLINTHPANNTAGVALRAQLTATGNGIELVDENPTGAGTLTVTSEFGSEAAEYLGLTDETGDRVSTTGTLTGDDQLFLEADSVFNTLVRLERALTTGDIQGIGRALDKLDDDIDQVASARANAGARVQGLNVTQINLEDEEVQLRAALSEQIDVDLVDAISRLTARQTSLQASLQTTANLLQLSLLNFL